MPSDPRFDALRQSLDRRTPFTDVREPSVSEAAVLLVLRPTDPLELLLIERAELEGDPWSGHMALPGGRRDPEDTDLLATALRETEEETGIVVPRADVVGRLDELGPAASRRRFNLIIAPFVAAVPAGTGAEPAPAEVETALWVPLTRLASDDAVDEVLIQLEGEEIRLPALNYDDYIIWGLTHRILTGFMEIAHGAGVVG
jgi:8-oxo-dGTP pyrophosphatase MutT (NUDIX family)